MDHAPLKPYPAYKPATIPWLPQVPDHWEVKPGLAHLRFKQVKNTGMVEKRVLSLSYGRIVIKPQEKLTGLVPESFETYQIVDPGDIIIRATDLQNDRTSLRVGEVKDRGIITSAYLCLNVHAGMVPAFGYHLIHAYDLMKWLYGYGSGLRQNLDWGDFKRMPLVVPPLAEQHLIVRYLRALDAKVKRYIRTKRKLIAALQEQKQAIIQRAVTRGLDPNVKLKPSGVEWLGEVPEHWEVLNLGRVIQLLTGFPFKSEEFSRNSDDVRLLRGINIAPSGIRWDEVVFWKRSPDDGLGAFELRVGDIVLGMDRPVISSGVRATTIDANDTPALLLQRVARLRPTDRLDSTFLLLLLKGRLFTSYIEPIFTGISVPHLSPKQIRGFTIALPSIDEQHAIIRSIKVETGAIDEAISLAHREILVLEEYHTRLIADVVTGAVDVREAARKLPVDQMIGRSDDQMMEEEVLSLAAEGEAEYGEPEER